MNISERIVEQTGCSCPRNSGTTGRVTKVTPPDHMCIGSPTRRELTISKGVLVGFSSVAVFSLLSCGLAGHAAVRSPLYAAVMAPLPEVCFETDAWPRSFVLIGRRGTTCQAEARCRRACVRTEQSSSVHSFAFLVLCFCTERGDVSSRCDFFCGIFLFAARHAAGIDMCVHPLVPAVLGVSSMMPWHPCFQEPALRCRECSLLRA